MRFENDRIFFYMGQTKTEELPVNIRSKERKHVQGRFAVEGLLGGGIDMRNSEIQFLLRSESQGTQIRSFWQDISQFHMNVLDAAFLTGSHTDHAMITWLIMH